MARWTVRTTSRSRPQGKGGRVGASIFLAIFLLVGLLFTGAILWGLVESARVYSWERAECVIDSSTVREGGEGAWEVEVAYHYDWKGREHPGDRIAPNYSGSDSRSETQRLADRLAPGARVPCRVDPQAPERAYLQTSPLWFGFAALLPLIFVAVGGGGLWFLWRPEEPPAPEVEAAAESISERAGSKKGIGCGVIGWIFFLAGAGFSLFFVLPAIRVVEARSWRQVPCEVLESRVESHRSDDGTTYSVEVVYRYEVDGREYTANRYRFLGGSSSGYEGKKEVVDRLPAGTLTSCWVDPDDPYEAVMDRGFGWEFLLVLLPLVFVVVGGAGIVLSVGGTLARRARRPRQTILGEGTFRELAPGEGPEGVAGEDPYRPRREPLELEPRQGPLGQLFVTLGVAIFWNGFVGVFLYFVIRHWERDPQWFAALILTPFVLIGLLLLAGIPYQFLALFNPRPRLTLTPGSIPLGGTGRLDWELVGAGGRVRDLRVWLEGREEASYTRGTDRVTDRSVFREIELAGGGSIPDVRRGSVEVRIPPDVMHSFESDHNKVVWTLKLKGSIPFWPDVGAEYPVRVVPPEDRS